MEDHALLIYLFGPVLLGLGLLVFLLIAYRKKLRVGEGSRIGINFSDDLRCPSCGMDLPKVRRPKNVRQMLWGGWTCERCGTECDKWLKPLPRK